MEISFREFDETDMRETGRLIDLWKYLSGNPKSAITGAQSDLLDVVAAAERALEVGRAPLALFRWLLSHWQQAKTLISNAQEQRAQERLRKWRQNQPKRPAFIESNT